MRSWRIVLLHACWLAAAHAQTQTKGLWAGWEPFLGTWEGAGSGDPGPGRGEFSLAPELQGAVLVRHNFSEYPASKDKPAYRHDDLMVVYSPVTKRRGLIIGTTKDM